MKENICTAAGVIGGFFAALLGGWDSALITLVLFMAIDLQHKKAERLSRKELLLGMISELEKTDMMIHEFDEKLWRLMVEKVTVSADGKLAFTLRNGMEK